MNDYQILMNWALSGDALYSALVDLSDLFIVNNSPVEYKTQKVKDGEDRPKTQGISSGFLQDVICTKDYCARWNQTNMASFIEIL